MKCYCNIEMRSGWWIMTSINTNVVWDCQARGWIIAIIYWPCKQRVSRNTVRTTWTLNIDTTAETRVLFKLGVANVIDAHTLTISKTFFKPGDHPIARRQNITENESNSRKHNLFQNIICFFLPAHHSHCNRTKYQRKNPIYPMHGYVQSERFEYIA